MADAVRARLQAVAGSAATLAAGNIVYTRAHPAMHYQSNEVKHSETEQFLVPNSATWNHTCNAGGNANAGNCNMGCMPGCTNAGCNTGMGGGCGWKGNF